MSRFNNASRRIVNFIRNSAILRSSEVTDYYKHIFDKCDVDKDGQVSLIELEEFIAGTEGDEVPEEVVKAVLQRFDKNKDERLDFHEFLELINNPTVLQTFTRIGSCYIKYVGVSSYRTKSLKLARTVTNTGVYEEQMSCHKYTICMVLLSVLELSLYYMNKMHRDLEIEEALEFNHNKRHEIWRYITYILVHDNDMHLYANLSVQIIIGVPLEIVHSWRVPVIYLVGACGSCMITSVVKLNNDLAGASGGVYAFFTAHIAVVLLNWREMTHPIVHLVIFGIVVVFDAIYNYLYPNGDVRTSFITHLGGAIIGFLMGVIFLKNIRVTKKEKILWKLCLAVLVVLMTNVVILNFVLALDIYNKIY